MQCDQKWTKLEDEGPTLHCSFKGELITSCQDGNHSPEELENGINR